MSEKLTPKPRQRKAVGYFRFSPRPGETDSIEVQRQQVEMFCERENLKLVRTYQDERISGAEEVRPGLWDMIDHLRVNDVVVVSRLDRLARDVALALIIEKRILDKQATIASVAGEGTVGDEPGDVFIRNLFRSFAQFERQLIAERTKVKLAHLKRQGKPIGPKDKVLYGWQIVDGSVIACEHEQQAVRRMVELRNAGFTYGEISARLVADGFKPRRGDGWNAGTINRLLARNGLKKVVVQPPEDCE